MVCLIKTDPKGPMGPMTTLVCGFGYLKNEAVEELADQAEKNVRSYTKFEGAISGKEEFCKEYSEYKTRIDVIQSEFMQNVADIYNQMRKTPISDFYHTKVVEVITPLQMSSIERDYPDLLQPKEKVAVAKWITTYLEGMMTDKQIQDVVDNPMTPEAFQQRMAVGAALISACNNKELTEDDFNQMITLIQSSPTFTQEAKPVITALVGGYMEYLGMNGNKPSDLTALVGLLEITRQKYFPKVTA